VKSYEIGILKNNDEYMVLYVPIFYDLKQIIHCLELVLLTSKEENYELFMKYDNQEMVDGISKVFLSKKYDYLFLLGLEYLLFKMDKEDIKCTINGVKELCSYSPIVIGKKNNGILVEPLKLEDINNCLKKLPYRAVGTLTKTYEDKLIKTIRKFIDLEYFYYTKSDSIFKLNISTLDQAVFILVSKDNDVHGHLDIFFDESSLHSYLNALSMSNINKRIYFEKITIDFVGSFNKSSDECFQFNCNDLAVQVYRVKPGFSDYSINNKQARQLLKIIELFTQGIECLTELGDQGTLDDLIVFDYDKEDLIESVNQSVLSDDGFLNQFILNSNCLSEEIGNQKQRTEFYQVDIVNFTDMSNFVVGSYPIKNKIIVANNEISIVRDVVDYSVSKLFEQVVSVLLDAIKLNGIPSVIQANSLNILAFVTDLCINIKAQEELTFQLDNIEDSYFEEIREESKLKKLENDDLLRFIGANDLLENDEKDN
jgi:hypothetical protein